MHKWHHLRNAGTMSRLKDRLSRMPVVQKKEATNIGSKTNVSTSRCHSAGTNPPELVGRTCSNSPYRVCSAGPVTNTLSTPTASSRRVS